MAQRLGHWISGRRIASSKYLGGVVIDLVFHTFKIDKIGIWLKVAYIFVVTLKLWSRWTQPVKMGLNLLYLKVLGVSFFRT